MLIQQLNTHDRAFPARLHNLFDTPDQLFVRGNLTINTPMVGIVGSRRPSHYGRRVAEDFAASLAKQGIGVVSGLALGIDAIAHASCIKNGGYTIAVLAHGLDTVHPRANSQLAEAILKSKGALLSEYSSGTPALPHQFLARNRIVASLCDMLLIVEATERSGTLSTARFALEVGISVGAIPGSIHSVLSKGTHNLIKAGAHPVTTIDDITSLLGLAPEKNTQIIGELHAHEQSIIDELGRGRATIDQIQESCKLPYKEAVGALTSLEIKGLVRPDSAGGWTRN